MTKPSLQLLAALAIALGTQSIGAATAERTRNIDGIRDNSFLVEEAYNQEAGVVQHIVTLSYDVDRQPGADERVWTLHFIQEWPLFSQTHQIGYTVPYLFVRSGGRSTDGFGDVSVDYRYEAYFNEDTLRAVAPRFSLILPTGDHRKGLGEDTVGYQLNLPVSTALGDYWYAHANAGTTFLPDAASGDGRDFWNFNLGASVMYAVLPDLHFVLEWVGNWDETVRASGGSTREFSSVILPGVRKAFDFASGAQVVAGLGAPIGLTRPAPDFGVFLYLSFEHGFLK